MRKILLTALIAVLAGVTVSGTAQASPSGAVRWGACPADAAGPGLQCSTIEVPLDYAQPDGRKATIAISRLATARPGLRRGVLLTNTGGPGGVGLGYPAELAQSLKLPQSVLDRYDVIGFDPRGVGHSTPVTCDLQPGQVTSDIPPFARDPLDVVTHAATAKKIAGQCGSSKTASILPYITTANTARDMDRIRAALGEPKLSYLGISYGTYLGAVYTTLFPQRSDRIVLDSSTGPTGFDRTTMRRLGLGVQDRFPDFAKYVAAHPEFGLGTTPAQVEATYYRLAGQLDAKPTPEGIDGALFRQLTFSQLYYDSTLPGLAKGWQQINEGRPLTPPSGGGTPVDPVALENGLASQLSVICNDSRWPTSVQTYQRDVAVDRVRYPMFGAAAANITPCAFWPSQPIEPPVKIGDRGPSDVLMVQNLRDPATPLAGARQLRQAFGDRARMVTADQGGHLAYLYKSNTCLNDITTEFLATGTRPQHDVACAAEPA